MSKSRLNSRQKRAREAHRQALSKAIAANPSTVAPSGSLRSSTTGSKARILDETYYGFTSGLRQAAIKPKPVTIQGSKLGAHEGVAGKIVDGKVKTPMTLRSKRLGISNGINVTNEEV